mmetsp:Transcript_10741/g.16304  ORF Transcript_10741/g.16304 Transcript_10741/m.16304 type:complete len:84 (+) Transcript_10741:214-465(+)
MLDATCCRLLIAGMHGTYYDITHTATTDIPDWYISSKGTNHQLHQSAPITSENFHPNQVHSSLFSLKQADNLGTQSSNYSSHT